MPDRPRACEQAARWARAPLRTRRMAFLERKERRVHQPLLHHTALLRGAGAPFGHGVVGVVALVLAHRDARRLAAAVGKRDAGGPDDGIQQLAQDGAF